MKTSVAGHPIDVYLSFGVLQAARNRMVEYKIPQDAQWGDIDIMERSLDFTGNQTQITIFGALI